ncbi:MAG TPA: hypothetical protein VMG13_23645 [Trebonia sp.]|nr:hypothetical protein [Trebonia sp.]
MTLRVLPDMFLSDVLARSAHVLSAHPRVDIECTIDAAAAPGAGAAHRHPAGRHPADRRGQAFSSSNAVSAAASGKEEPIAGHNHGTISEDEAITRIASRFLVFASLCRTAVSRAARDVLV